MEPFWVSIKVGYKVHKVLVKPALKTDRIEQFEVVGRDRSIVVESNRPFFRNRGLRHRMPLWKVVQGQAAYMPGLEQLYEQIIKKLEP